MREQIKNDISENELKIILSQPQVVVVAAMLVTGCGSVQCSSSKMF